MQGRWIFIPESEWAGLQYNHSAEAWIWEKGNEIELKDVELPETYHWIVPATGGTYDFLHDKWIRLCTDRDTPGGPSDLSGSDVQPGGTGWGHQTIPFPGGYPVWVPDGWKALQQAARGDKGIPEILVGLLGAPPPPGDCLHLDDLTEFAGPGYTRLATTLQFRGDPCVDGSIGIGPVVFPNVDCWDRTDLYGAYSFAKFPDGSGILLWVLGSQTPIVIVCNQGLAVDYELSLHGIP